jgi:hypothetical protein
MRGDHAVGLADRPGRILNPWNLKLIIEQATVPVLVDAGVGTASDAAIAMELGCAGVLMNTAIAQAQDPVRMARAMKLAVEAGRDAFLAGRMPRKLYAGSPSSPTSERSRFGSGGGRAVALMAVFPYMRHRSPLRRHRPVRAGRRSHIAICLIEAEQLKALPSMPSAMAGRSRYRCFLGRANSPMSTRFTVPPRGRCGITGAPSTSWCCSPRTWAAWATR